jgi:hypothetical protein
MSATNAMETAILQLYFNNTDHANVGDAAGLQNSAAAGSFYVSLHTADPGETGTQATSETAYTGYARLAVARSGAGWTVAGNAASNAAVLTFGTCTAAPGGNITHFGIGSDVSGSGNLFFSGALGAAYTPAVSNAPTAAIGAISTTAD